MSNTSTTTEFDFRQTYAKNRLVGLWRMMNGYHLAYLTATLSLAVAALARTGTAYLLRFLVDDILGEQAATFTAQQLSRALLVVALGFVGLALVEGSFSFFSGRLAAFTAESIARRLRNYLLNHIQRLPFTYHKKTSTGELIERATSDLDAVRRFYSDQAINIGRIVMLFIINFTAIYLLSPVLAFVSIIAIPIVLGVSAFFFKKVKKAYESYQQQEAVLSTTLQENLTGVRVVKAFARQDYEKEKFEKQNRQKYQMGRKLVSMHAFFWPISDLVCGAQLVLGFIVAGLMAINGTITPGTYLAYVGLVGWLIWPMRNLGRLIVNTSTGLVSYGRVMDVISKDREPMDEGSYRPVEPPRGEIVFDQVGFEYEEGEQTLQDVSFRVEPGQVIALLGPTGSGKTTLVNLLPRFYEYTRGRLTLDGIELKDYPRSYLRSQIGIVEQEPFLFSRTIRENITFGVAREVPQEEVEAAALAAAIHDSIITFPDGYDTLVGEKGVTLSGGQKQRVAIARALLKNPRILIMDDSTSSVDTETEASIREALQCLMKERTTFVIAHRIQSVMNADLIVVLDKGHIVQIGSHSELLAQQVEPNIYRMIYDIQTRIDAELEEEIAKVDVPV